MSFVCGEKHKRSGCAIRTDAKPYFVPKWEQVFVYDDDGNLISDSVWDYTYDAENRLVSMETRSEVLGSGMLDDADARKLLFTYDYQGRRVRKIVYHGWNGSTYNPTPLSDTKYLYDGWNLIAEFDVKTSMSLDRSYTWGLDLTGDLTAASGVGGLLQVYDADYGSGETLLPAYDGNDNIAAMMKSDGSLAAVYDGADQGGDGRTDRFARRAGGEANWQYDPYGNLLRKEGDYSSANPFRFSTKYTDDGTDLVYYGHRYYSPSLGRFINRDPIEEQGGINLYTFVGNNAVNAWDYLGMVVPWWEDQGINGDDLYYDGGSYDWGNGSGGGVQVSSGGNDFNGSADVPGTGVAVTASEPNPSNPNDPGVLTHTYDQTWWYDEGIDGNDYFTIQGQIDGSIRMLEPMAVSANSTYTHFSTWGTNPTFTSTSAAAGGELNTFLDQLRQLNTERKSTDPYLFAVVTNKLANLPEFLKNWKPGNLWGNYVYDMGDHDWNLRLPGGYHLSMDGGDGQVYLHYDAYDPLEGPIQTLLHWFHEVRNLNNGTLEEQPAPVGDHPDLSLLLDGD